MGRAKVVSATHPCMDTAFPVDCHAADGTDLDCFASTDFTGCTDAMSAYEDAADAALAADKADCTSGNGVWDSVSEMCAGCATGYEDNGLGGCDAVAAVVSTSTSTTTSTSATHALTNPLGSTDLRVVIGYIIKALLGLSGAIALFVFVWSGIMMMLAAGSPEKIKTAKNSLTWATIGLVVIFTAYTLVYTLITALSTGTTG